MTHHRHHHDRHHSSHHHHYKDHSKHHKQPIVYNPSALRQPWTQWIPADDGDYWYRYTYNYAGQIIYQITRNSAVVQAHNAQHAARAAMTAQLLHQKQLQLQEEERRRREKERHHRHDSHHHHHHHHHRSRSRSRPRDADKTTLVAIQPTSSSSSSGSPAEITVVLSDDSGSTYSSTLPSDDHRNKNVKVVTVNPDRHGNGGVVISLPRDTRVVHPRRDDRVVLRDREVAVSPRAKVHGWLLRE